MGFLIREVRESDAEATAAMFNSLIEEGKYTIVVEPFTLSKSVDFIRHLQSHGVYHVAVAEEDQSLLGIQVLLPFSEMNSLKHVGDIGTYVSTTSHRSGIGRALTEATFKRAKEHGFQKIMAMIRGDNPRAQAFYRSIGFQEIGVAKRHAFVRGEYIDEVLMETFL